MMDYLNFGLLDNVNVDSRRVKLPFDVFEPRALDGRVCTLCHVGPLC
jgi:hypothetical protein